MDMIEIRPGNVRDITYIAANMRDKDWEEISAVVPPEWDRTHTGTIAYSSEGLCWTAWYKGLPTTAFGFARSHLPHLYSAWAFGTDRMQRTIPEVSRFIFREAVPYLLAKGVRRVEARALATHKQSVGWLLKMGGQVDAEMKEYGLDGETFLLVSWTSGTLPERYTCDNGQKHAQHLVDAPYVLQSSASPNPDASSRAV